MSEKINRMIPVAMKAIETSGMMKDDHSVPSEYKGYIVSMAASIMRTGLLTTITFYTRSSRTDSDGNASNEGGKAENTNLLLDAILKLLPNDTSNGETDAKNLMEYTLKRCIPDYNNARTIRMSDVKVNHDKLTLLGEEIQDVLYALKLALRTFDLKKSES